MKKIQISTKKTLLFIALYACLIKQFISYIGAGYERLTEGSYAFAQHARTDRTTFLFTAIAFVSILCLFFLYASKAKFSFSSVLTFLVLIIGVAFWLIITLKEIGFVETLYSSTSPYVYLTVLAVAIGMDEELFSSFLRHARFLGLLSLALALYSYFSFLTQYPDAILGNSSVLVCFIQAFWLLCIYSFCAPKPQALFVYFCIMLCAVLAILFNSRSWIIQSFIWLILYIYASGKQKGVLKICKIIAVVVLCVIPVYYLVTLLFPETVAHLVQKMSPTETRLAQYTDLFSQTTLSDFLFGQGYSFRYYSSLQGTMYNYIDNAYLLMLVRYGISVGLTYTLIFLAPLIKAKFNPSSIPLFMWLLAIGGLSVYCVTTMDLKSIALAIVAGRCMFLHRSEAVTHHSKQGMQQEQ